MTEQENIEFALGYLDAIGITIKDGYGEEAHDILGIQTSVLMDVFEDMINAMDEREESERKVKAYEECLEEMAQWNQEMELKLNGLED